MCRGDSNDIETEFLIVLLLFHIVTHTYIGTCNVLSSVLHKLQLIAVRIFITTMCSNSLYSNTVIRTYTPTVP